MDRAAQRDDDSGVSAPGPEVSWASASKSVRLLSTRVAMCQCHAAGTMRRFIPTTPRIFLPSTPTLRESVKPLVSMWLDSLILRLMERQTTTAPVWFVVDELATLAAASPIAHRRYPGPKVQYPLGAGVTGPESVGNPLRRASRSHAFSAHNEGVYAHQ